MRPSLYLASILAASSFAACGKSETPTPPPTPAGVADDVAGSTPPTPAPTEPVAVEPKPDTLPTPEPAKGPSYIVWMNGDSGPVSHWLAPGQNGLESVASRPQLTVFADETLWGLERPTSQYRQITCEAFEGETDEAPAKPSNTLQTVEYLALRGLAGADAGKERPVTDKLPDYFEKEPDAKGIYTIVGELWGRHLSVVGGANDLLLVEECASAFSCGAHGDASCQFIQFPVGDNAKNLDLAAARAALKADTQSLVKKWEADSEGEVEGDPSLDAIFVGFDKGALKVDYLLVAGVSYAATDGEWGSYTQSRKHTGSVVPALGMPELPAEVGAWLATQGASSAVGWSTVPVDADAAIAGAFKDASTVPAEAPKAVEGAAQGGADAGALVKKARKLTRDRELDDAISTFTSAIEADGKHARAWSGRGYARLLAGDLQGADADFKHALTLDDGAKFQGAVYYNLGELAEKQKKITEAVEAYQKSNSLAPTDAAQKRIDALTAE